MVGKTKIESSSSSSSNAIIPDTVATPSLLYKQLVKNALPISF